MNPASGRGAGSRTMDARTPLDPCLGNATPVVPSERETP
jgi:hypothetical protein